MTTRDLAGKRQATSCAAEVSWQNAFGQDSGLGAPPALHFYVVKMGCQYARQHGLCGLSVPLTLKQRIFLISRMKTRNQIRSQQLNWLEVVFSYAADTVRFQSHWNSSRPFSLPLTS